MSAKKKITEAEYLRQKLALLEQQKELHEGLPHKYGFPWYKWAREVYESTNPEILLVAANQISKAQCIETDIPTPSGVKKLKDLRVGDFVFGQDGRPTKVVAIPFDGIDDSFDFIFNDGSSVISSKDHLWICKGSRQRFRKSYKTKTGRVWENAELNQWVIKSTQQIISDAEYGPTARAYERHSVPVSAPTVIKSRRELFDPYYIGLFIGNGSTRVISFNAEDADVCAYAAKYGNIRQTKGGGQPVGINEKTFYILEDLGLNVRSQQKDIPPQYLGGSIEQRADLLAGLMDTDGTCSEDGATASYATTSYGLAKSFCELVCSLGGIAQIKKRKAGYKKDGKYIKCSDCYVVQIWMQFNPFRSKRKSMRWRETTKYKHERVITEIRPVGRRRVKCITVDNVDGSYLCTRQHIVTHNSSTAIRKNIEIATEPDKWKTFWPRILPGIKPNLFWYFYSTLNVATTEFESKWEPQFLPRNAYKKSSQHGWHAEWEKGYLHSLRFNTGIIIQFKTYSMKIKDLQTASVYMVTADEEMPVDYFPEIKNRLNATDGLFMSVFTATLGQDFWRRAMEPLNGEIEVLPNALKKQISLYDSMTYEDGTPSPWTKEKIERAKANCPTEFEIQRRIYGRFVKAHGLRYESFNIEHNTCDKHPLPKTWAIYSAVDPGSGGQSGHPAAILFLAVNPERTEGRFFRAWRGDGIPTAASDILEKYRELKGSLTMTLQVYDYAAKDFHTIASRAGESFIPADKGRDSGAGILNTLFKNKMVKIQRGDPELDKLVQELCSLPVDIDKRKAKDDLVDCARYLASAVGWDFSGIEGVTLEKDLKEDNTPIIFPTPAERRKAWFLGEDKEPDSIDQEFDFWNEHSGSSD